MALIGHTDIARFASERVNLPKENADKHRTQVRGLRDRLKGKISADATFDLVKMLHSGSVAKGTALRTVNDLDVAVYVKATAAPSDDAELQPWLAARLAEANPNLDSSQFEAKDHCVTVSFRGSGLDVDMAPVIYEGQDHDYGYLVRKHSGERVLTSIPLHLEFIRSRKAKYGDNYQQLIRLVKWWKRNQGADFRFKSFMIELLWAHLADSGVPLDDYHAALEAFFAFIAGGQLDEPIAFADYYSISDVATDNQTPIQIFDPVNAANNVASSYSTADLSALVDSAQRAFDALSEAHYSTTKADAVGCWQDVLGSSFRG